MKTCLFSFCCYIGIISEFSFMLTTSLLISHGKPPARLRQPMSRNVCPSIVINNGLAKRRTSRARVVRFYCNRGYLLAGERHSTCVRNKWDPPPPRCVRPTCKPIGTQLNGDNLLVYRTHSNAVQHFFCKAGYTLNGPSVIYCNGTTWSAHVPICLAINTKPELKCDFETPDICGWTHDLNHDFDWTRENYNTPSGSIGTGPTFDHTKGIGKGGYYMYIESSSRAENDTARLISPVYDKMDTDVCLEFYYHMFGATIGTLRAYVKDVNDSWSLNEKMIIFSKHGNQGDNWFRSYHHLGIRHNEFQIIIEGVRGAGYVSDIAIDDVRIIPNCTNEETTTIIESSTYNELIPTVDSCDNRCGQIASVNFTDHLTCDCDDDCFIRNRCCPDYYDICSETTLADDFDNELASGENPKFTTEKFWHHTFPSTTSRTLPLKTTSNFVRTTTAPIKLYSTKSTTLPERKIPIPTRPIIHLQTPPPTPVIYRKILKTTQTPFITKPTKETDIIDVPRPTNIDVGIYDAVEGAKEFWSDEIENNIDSPFVGNFSESKKLFSQTQVETTSSNFMILGVSLSCVIVLISVVVFFIIRRYRFSRGFMSSNGQSQSDVRYLTSEDALDFSLADDEQGIQYN